MPRRTQSRNTAALIPLNEKARLEAVYDCSVLDWCDDPQLNKITHEAQALCQTSMALISIVEEHRQCFISRQGIAERHTSREFSFCAHAIVEPDAGVFVVFDTRHDQRFAMNPLVTGDPYIRFYAGAPLVLSNGLKIGTLCVLDQRPRKVVPMEQMRNLEKMAQKIVKLIEDRSEERQKRQSPASNCVDAHVGMRLRQQRERLGLSRQKLETKAKMAPGDLKDIENGITRIGGMQLLETARILGVKISYFFE